ncbi:hypothetical protein pgond44_02263 [Psychroflexus gondwanensis ACAM 44]|jgi:hypothetical protein|uniref:Uncharacterized protein n=1 Tax=Psychroflexus gondwanensis ACAM 44 TaxID=1189619 RepID=N1WSR9_9FLAO|nr:hypothetical protein [Psychroflexus gondwanensis]EMY82030.1 hypothetical protein pgond44_02263 [Psychroflexus gondwanensis ACAM 44]
MILSTILLQDRWTGGWVEYGIYGIVLIGIAAFLIYKISKGKDRKQRNKRLRDEDIEKRQKE